MARWEEDVAIPRRRTELVLWARYIHDILFLWRGDSTSLIEFMSTLNQNNRSIILSHEMNQKEMNFLDFTIKVENGRLLTSSSFKATDHNAYISRESCHHWPWLEGVPKEQILHLRRKCTTLEDFDRETGILKKQIP